MKKLITSILLLSVFTLFSAEKKKRPFFQASQKQPYHLSIGAILFDKTGRVACHHFSKILDSKDVYILMRESMEDNETPLETLSRGLKEEFGAYAKPIAFLGCLSGYLPNTRLPFEKTTLYIACLLDSWDPEVRDSDDSEAGSNIEWLEPTQLIEIMEKQGQKFKRVDVDESEMIIKALPYIHDTLQQDSFKQEHLK
ncbi:MAG: NUDIX hydrolase [Chlamydiota bacterium]|jgi:hypothetical protein